MVAGQNLNQGYHYAIQQKYQATPEYLPRYGMHFLDTDQVGCISDLLGIHGEGQTVGGASASGNVGIIHGYRLVQWGMAVCVVVSALQVVTLRNPAFAALGALGGKTIGAADRACRPFDQLGAGLYLWAGEWLPDFRERSLSATAMGLPLGRVGWVWVGARWQPFDRSQFPMGEAQAMHGLSARQSRLPMLII